MDWSPLSRDPVQPTSDMSPQGSAWRLPRSQGHCFGGQTRARLFCSGMQPAARRGLLNSSSLEVTFPL